ncbi:uracil-DNA glycosylase [Blastopirellula sp. JC732]|uniref:Type-4 uracil-DNA glycosylase n=1 Tax=Blastopirellula sediminis TaxID=2894196 RepID=A0A9X1SH43_9BACT|nr:uracil-DNA glycosylase [Blastopirellula sediminis]MCC9607311.1 uracil-DNA glycosylase [Blastopirellula sediminis]MCC9629396.1 uracil-DNA glycosylase [Blastopirellula sediminis]
MSDDPQAHLRRAMLQQLRDWQSAGVDVAPHGRVLEVPEELLRAEVPAAPIAATPAPPVAPQTSAPKTSAPPPEPKRPTAPPPTPRPAPAAAIADGDKQQQLEILAAEVAQCVKCQELACTRTQTVFGVGNPNARICFFGEAPGADEDKQGEPFVGRAGQLLTQIIEACTFRREDVYILNTLKCRPPGNRNPTPEENANCMPYFVKQLEIIQPEYIVCLGKFAAQNLLQTEAAIGRLRGTFHEYNGAKVIATYHPAYLLRNPSAKRDVWEDMKMMLRDMGISIPGAK